MPVHGTYRSACLVTAPITLPSVPVRPVRSFRDIVATGNNTLPLGRRPGHAHGNRTKLITSCSWGEPWAGA